MPLYEPLALISLALSVLAAWAIFLQTQMPPVRRAQYRLNRQDYRGALKAATTGIGQMPWAWVENERFTPIVINWLATEKELKEIAQEVFNQLPSPSQDFQEAFGRWLILLNEADRVAMLAVQRQLGDYNEGDWNVLSVERAKARISVFRTYPDK